MTLVWLAIGLALLAGSAVALYFSTRNDALAAYSSAPACATLADAVAGNDCRYTLTAQITQLGGYGDTTDVYFDVPGQYVPFWMGTVPGTGTSLIAGAQIQVEVWRLKVTRIEGAPTTDNPALDTRPRTLQVIGGLLLILGLGATAGAIFVARRRARVAPGGEPSMNPVAMSDVLWR